MTVLISGAGIAGLSLGLTLHQIGVPFRIFESVQVLQPLGVGINLQPSAVRELFDLGLETELDALGVRTRSYGFYTKSGREIWTEPRGKWAGYRWPQYSVHRGAFQMMLYRTLILRAGEDCVDLGPVQAFDRIVLMDIHRQHVDATRQQYRVVAKLLVEFGAIRFLGFTAHGTQIRRAVSKFCNCVGRALGIDLL